MQMCFNECKTSFKVVFTAERRAQVVATVNMSAACLNDCGAQISDSLTGLN